MYAKNRVQCINDRVDGPNLCEKPSTQGYGEGSTWTRGQAWGIYGFAIISRYLQSAEMLGTAKQLGRYFVSGLPEDGVAYWDFDAPVGPDTKRDSSASAIAACGLLEIAAQLGEADPEYRFFREAAEAAVRALAEHYSTHGSGEAEGLLKHGSYSVRAGESPDDYTIWGDYYYLEALMRLERGIPGYWYERPVQ